MPALLTPEAEARIEIDRKLQAAGWTLQDPKAIDLYNYKAVAIREFSLTTGEADYLLVVDKKAIGVVEAKARGYRVRSKPGTTLCAFFTRARVSRPPSEMRLTPNLAAGWSSLFTGPKLCWPGQPGLRLSGAVCANCSRSPCPASAYGNLSSGLSRGWTIL